MFRVFEILFDLIEGVVEVLCVVNKFMKVVMGIDIVSKVDLDGNMGNIFVVGLRIRENDL